MRARHSRALASLAVALAAGCGDDDPPTMPEDADASDAAPDAIAIDIVPPTPPAEAALPDLRPCLPGWALATSSGGAHVCAPFGGMRRTCVGATMQLPSSSTCERIGPACPSGPFPDDAPSTAIYALAGATGGDGTRSAPFGTIGAAVAAAAPGGIVVIGKGEYAENVAIDEPLTLRGACVEETRLLGAGEEEVTLRVEPPEDAEPIAVAVRSLTIASTNDVIYSRRTALTLEGLHVAPASAGITADELHARRMLVRGQGYTPGIACKSCEIEDVVIEGFGELGILTYDGEARIENLALLATDDLFHSGMSVGTTTRATLIGIAAHGAAVAFGSGDSETDVTMASVEDYPLVATFDQRSTGRLSQVWATRGDAGPRINVLHEATTSVSRAVFEHGERDDSGQGDTALHAAEGGRLTLDRVLIDDHADTAMVAADGATIRGSDVIVRDLHRSIDRATGFGAIATGATIELTRTRIERCEGGAVVAFGSGTSITLADVVVREGGSTSGLGIGIGVFDGATMRVERAQIEHAPEVGLFAVGEGTHVTGTDVDVRDTQPTATGNYGRALEVETAASVELERVSLLRSYDHGVAAVLGGHIELREARIVDALSRPCAATDCADDPYGIAIGSYNSTVELERFEIRRAALCGVRIDDRSSVSLHRGVIAENAAGVCVDRDDYDLSQLESEVVYESNGRNLDARRLPVPSPVPPPDVPAGE